METIKYKLYKSYSGDWFKIPTATAERDINDYVKALRDGDEKTMIKFESGMTGGSIMSQALYKKVVSDKGRVTYVPVRDYSPELTDSMPEGAHLHIVKPGTRSYIYNVNPDMITLMAAFKLIKTDFVSILLKCSEYKPEKQPITQEQKAAWDTLKEAFNGECSTLYGPSLNDVAEKVGELIMNEAAELLKNPVVKNAWDKFQTIATLSKE